MTMVYAIAFLRDLFNSQCHSKYVLILQQTGCNLDALTSHLYLKWQKLLCLVWFVEKCSKWFFVKWIHFSNRKDTESKESIECNMTSCKLPNFLIKKMVAIEHCRIRIYRWRKTVSMKMIRCNERQQDENISIRYAWKCSRAFYSLEIALYIPKRRYTQFKFKMFKNESKVLSTLKCDNLKRNEQCDRTAIKHL